jgi:hypothetical protein
MIDAIPATALAGTERPEFPSFSGRLSIFLTFVLSELRLETWRAIPTSREWQDSVTRLQLASTPLKQIANPNVGDPLVNRFRQFVASAISVLADTDDCGRSQFTAIDFLRDAELTLLQLRAQFKIAPPVTPAHLLLPSERSVSFEFEQGMRDFDCAIGSRMPIPICMASRVQFLRAHYLAVVHPQLWNSDRHMRLVNLHVAAAQAIPEGMEEDSIRRRLAMLQRFTPQEFASVANSPPEIPSEWMDNEQCPRREFE